MAAWLRATATPALPPRHAGQFVWRLENVNKSWRTFSCRGLNRGSGGLCRLSSTISKRHATNNLGDQNVRAIVAFADFFGNFFHGAVVFKRQSAAECKAQQL